jgi:hypothetical protein
VILVGLSGEIVRVVPGASPLPDRAELASLPTR